MKEKVDFWTNLLTITKLSSEEKTEILQKLQKCWEPEFAAVCNASSNLSQKKESTTPRVSEPDANEALLVNDADYPELVELRSSKECAYEIIYRWKPGIYVRTSYLLKGLRAQAVILNYRYPAEGRFTAFAFSLTDEKMVLTRKIAQCYAASKLPKFGGQTWTIADKRQVKLASLEPGKLTVLLKKLGGEAFRGKYSSDCAYGGRIRYTINLE